jgi:acetyl-CoA/propionyl-CoA carboxylase biotin carboxyl carrier protein
VSSPWALATGHHGRVLKKILIANRGEIAVRVIRAARELGIATVAVYSELDRNALRVRLADEAFALGGQTAAESYLNTEAIVRAIETSGADGVHPGYGFFSENADFARAMSAGGVTWIGPPPEAIEIMGDKISSRLAAERSNVLSVPDDGSAERRDTAGDDSGGAASGPPSAAAAGRRWSVGGGGARRWIGAAGQGLLRRTRSRRALLTWPHVGQIVGDQQGEVVGSSRDRSAQRRPETDEEAPAPALPAGVEQAMGKPRSRLLAVGYYNVGTVEFIYQDGEFSSSR